MAEQPGNGNTKEEPRHGPHRDWERALRLLRYLGPGLLVTIGFIDPGNWATNMAAGSFFGYRLLWVITLGTVMLVILQHNAAHLGIVTGYCLSEAATIYLPAALSRPVLASGVAAAVATAYAEILGTAVALQALCRLPLQAGIVLSLLFFLWLLWTNSYRRLEKLIMGFVSLIGLSFLLEVVFAKVSWPAVIPAWVSPTLPHGSMLVLMSLLGAVVMPHNLFLHSEIIQSRRWQQEDEASKRRRLKYEFLDTSFSMGVGWAINSAMLIVAAATFYRHGLHVSELTQAQEMLKPLLGNLAALVFALALLLAGISAALTAGMAGGIIYAGIFGEPYDIGDRHSRQGVLLTMIPAAAAAFFAADPFHGLILSQMILGIQLPVTVFLQIYLTSSRRVMGDFANGRLDRILLWAIGLLVSGLNLYLLYETVFGGALSR